MEDKEWPFAWDELVIDTYRTTGGGGFSMNKVDNGVRIKHILSGLEASCHTDRSQYRNKAEALKLLAALVQEWIAAGSPVADPDDPFPDKTDAELGFAYRMMVKAQQGGLVVNFMTGDISLPKSK